ncbi:MAG: hypothetical protein ABIS18_05785 [Actinomycetota bacterium]
MANLLTMQTLRAKSPIWAVFAIASLFCFLDMTAATADPGGVIVTQGSRYLPGDAEFSPSTAIVRMDADLTYLNLDVGAAHSITSDEYVDVSTPLFDSGPKNFRQSGPVVWQAPQQARSYGFHCSTHSGMRGTLTVVAT